VSFSRNVNRTFLVVLVAALWAPLAVLVFQLGDQRTSLAFEMTSPRPSQPKTLRALSQWPNSYRRYFNAHFGLRAWLMKAHATLKIQGFGVSSSDKVILGRDGWLFYAGGGALDDFRHARTFKPDELSTWLAALEARRNWLRRRGIEYLFFIAPNAQTIYPEYMPAEIRPVTSLSRLDQLTTYVHTHSDIHMVDLRPALLTAKQSDRLYFKTDTHWNQLGAFVAYGQLAPQLKAMFPRWRPDEMANFERVETQGWFGDLAAMLATTHFQETRIELIRKRPEVGGDPISSAIERQITNLTSAHGELHSLVVFRDSFFAAQAEYIARHFRRTVLVSTTDFDTEVVERERPEIVIQEFVERSLMSTKPSAPAPDRNDQAEDR